MVPFQEMILTLVDDDTVRKVEALFDSDRDRTGLESFDMSFRLYKADYGNINLELLTIADFDGGKVVTDPTLGKMILKERMTYFKPVGFFEKDSFRTEVTIPKEFEDDFQILIQENLLSTQFNINKLSLPDNAVIAAFSADTFMQAINIYRQREHGAEPIYARNVLTSMEMSKFDRKLRINGLDVEIMLTFEGYPQIFLEDKYNVKSSIANYLIQDGKLETGIHDDFEDNFQKLFRMSLLSGFKRI